MKKTFFVCENFKMKMESQKTAEFYLDINSVATGPKNTSRKSLKKKKYCK
jgi:hypothetical protein